MSERLRFFIYLLLGVANGYFLFWVCSLGDAYIDTHWWMCPTVVLSGIFQLFFILGVMCNHEALLDLL